MSYNVRQRLPCLQVLPDTKQLQLLDMGGVDINGSGSGVVMLCFVDWLRYYTT